MESQRKLGNRTGCFIAVPAIRDVTGRTGLIGFGIVVAAPIRPPRNRIGGFGAVHGNVEGIRVFIDVLPS